MLKTSSHFASQAKKSATAHNSPTRSFQLETSRKVLNNLQDVNIEIYNICPSKGIEDSKIQALCAETTKIPILKIAKLDQERKKAFLSHSKSHTNSINKKSLSPLKQSEIEHPINLINSNSNKNNLEDTLRKTFRRTNDFALKNLIEIQQISKEISNSQSESRMKFQKILEMKSKTLPRIKSNKNIDSQKITQILDPLVKQCQQIVNSVMKSHNVPQNATITEQLEVFAKLKKDCIFPIYDIKK